MTESTVVPASNPTVSTPTPPDYSTLRINEVMANPLTGKEWIEVVSTDPTQTIILTGCELHDGTGRIFTFDNVTLSPDARFAVATLSSNHLNNGGDSVSIYDPNGQLINEFTFGNTTKDEVWARSPDFTGDWTWSLTPTPDASNVVTQPQPEMSTTTVANSPAPTTVAATSSPAAPAATVSNVASPPLTPIQPVIEANTTDHPATTSIKPPTKTASVPKPTIPKAKTMTKTTKTTTSTKTVVPKTAAAKSTTAKTTKTAKTTTVKTSSITPLTFDMLNDQEIGLRVKLQGTVGSPPDLISKHGFVLLSEEGRGLLVTLPTTRKLPDMGNAVSIVGTLRFNDQNVPYLSVTTKDNWTVESMSSQPLRLRTVDLVAPSTEDAWSFVHVTGTVDQVGTSSFHVDLGDAE